MWTERCLSRIIIQHYWHRHTPPEFTKTHKISMVFNFCSQLFVWSLADSLTMSVQTSCLQNDPQYWPVLSLTAQLSVAGMWRVRRNAEKCWAPPALWSHVMTSCSSHSCHNSGTQLCCFFFSLAPCLDHVGRGRSERDIEERDYGP